MLFFAGRVKEACDGKSCAKDIKRSGSRKRRNPSEHQESGKLKQLTFIAATWACSDVVSGTLLYRPHLTFAPFPDSLVCVQPGSTRKMPPGSSTKVPRTPAHATPAKTVQANTSKSRAPVGMATPNHKTSGRNPPSSALSGAFGPSIAFFFV